MTTAEAQERGARSLKKLHAKVNRPATASGNAAVTDSGLAATAEKRPVKKLARRVERGTPITTEEAERIANKRVAQLNRLAGNSAFVVLKA